MCKAIYIGQCKVLILNYTVMTELFFTLTLHRSTQCCQYYACKITVYLYNTIVHLKSFFAYGKHEYKRDNQLHHSIITP